jgi:multiple sugar transport system substrate-binding protein
MNKSIRNGLAFLMVLALVGVVLVACGKKEAAEAKPAEFEFWTTETQSERMSTIQLLVDTFAALNPQLKVTPVPVDENDMPKQVAASSAAGTLPAIAEFGSENALAFGAEGLLDVEANTDLINSLGKNRFYSGTLKLLETTQKGSYYAIPYHGWIQGIWYRSDWFEKEGLEPPSSWEAIEKAAKTFYKPDQNQYGILVGTRAEVYSEQCFTQFAISNGARLFDKDGNLIFNSPEMKETIEFYAGLSQYNPPGPQTWRARDYYLQGKMAGFFYSTYIMDDLALQEVAAGSLTAEHFKDLKGSDFDPELANKTGFAPIIKNKQPSSYGVIVALGLFKNDDEAVTAGAKRFIEYMFTEDSYVSFLHMAPGGMNPVMKEIAGSDKFMKDPKGIFERYGKEKMGEIISGLESIQRFGIVEGNLIEDYGKIFAQQIIPQMIYKITQENMDVQKAMDWAEAEMKKAIQ